jgi:hypothetical protein
MSSRSRTIIPKQITLKEWKDRGYFLPQYASNYSVARAMIYVEVEKKTYIKVKVPKDAELFMADNSEEEGDPCYYVAIVTKGEPDTGKWTYINMSDYVHQDETKVQIFCSKEKTIYMGLEFLSP